MTLYAGGPAGGVEFRVEQHESGGWEYISARAWHQEWFELKEYWPLDDALGEELFERWGVEYACMMRGFTTTDATEVWVDDRHVVAVYGETNNVKVVCSVHQHERAFTLQVKGAVRDVALALNGYFDESPDPDRRPRE